MNRPVFLGLTTTLPALLLALGAQFSREGGEARRSDGLSEALDRAEASIKRDKPDLSGRLLSRDRDVIELLHPEIDSYFIKKNFRREQVHDAVGTAWHRVRMKSDAPLTFYKSDPGDIAAIEGKAKKDPFEKSDDGQVRQVNFFRFATGMGLLTVVTEPDGASVSLDKKSWGRTKIDGWEEEGTYPIHIEKEGYEDVDDEVKIVAGQETPFSRKLKRRR